MDTLLVALALLDGRTDAPKMPTIQPVTWSMERTATVRDTPATPLQTRVAVALKTPNIWGE